MSLPALALFVKGALPGKVKTRLVPSLTPEQACEMHRAFADDLVSLAADLPAEQFIFTDDIENEFVTDLARRAGVPLRQQHPGDLGDRMRDALEQLTPDHAGAVILGSDCPTLPPAFLREALERTATGVVLGPAVDGGYYLIGAPVPLPELFAEMPWSSPRVLAETLTRASSIGHLPHLLPFWYDVDTIEELNLLRAHLSMLPAEQARATRVALQALKPSSETGESSESEESGRKLTPPEEPR